ncbi:MAG TPA: NUDIX domain-containing protein [Gammaproteobacteria bacterium]|nr:NUDIX domain-containing protein [Gammaproteobacteria bacterium]
MEEEQFEILDDKGNAIGLMPRSRVHREGLWHRAVNVFLFRSDGRLIIQRRQWSKDIWPGAWDLSVAEHLQPGESYEQGAVRGLLEELGVDGVVLEPLGEVTRQRLEIADKGVKDYELKQSFRGVFDGVLHPDANEVSEIRTIDPAALVVEFRERPHDFTPWFRSSACSCDLQ